MGGCSRRRGMAVAGRDHLAANDSGAGLAAGAGSDRLRPRPFLTWTPHVADRCLPCLALLALVAGRGLREDGRLFPCRQRRRRSASPPGWWARQRARAVSWRMSHEATVRLEAVGIAARVAAVRTACMEGRHGPAPCWANSRAAASGRAAKLQLRAEPKAIEPLVAMAAAGRRAGAARHRGRGPGRRRARQRPAPAAPAHPARAPERVPRAQGHQGRGPDCAEQPAVADRNRAAGLRTGGRAAAAPPAHQPADAELRVVAGDRGKVRSWARRCASRCRCSTPAWPCW